jgi:hypothetical protein
MRRRSQANDLRTQLDSTIVAIVRNVIERNVNRHCGDPMLAAVAASPNDASLDPTATVVALELSSGLLALAHPRDHDCVAGSTIAVRSAACNARIFILRYAAQDRKRHAPNRRTQAIHCESQKPESVPNTFRSDPCLRNVREICFVQKTLLDAARCHRR